MAGYCGFSMSNNVVEAYERGLKPLSKWTKADVLSGVEELGFDATKFSDWNKEELKTLLYTAEWHHTSKHFNRTAFYQLDEDLVEKYANGILEKPSIKARTKSDFEEGFWHGKYKCTEYHLHSRFQKIQRVVC